MTASEPVISFAATSSALIADIRPDPTDTMLLQLSYPLDESVTWWLPGRISEIIVGAMPLCQPSIYTSAPGGIEVMAIDPLGGGLGRRLWNDPGEYCCDRKGGCGFHYDIPGVFLITV